MTDRTDIFASLRGTIPKLTADEMMFAMQAASAAYAGKMPMEPVDQRTGPIEIEGHGTIRLTDIPMNRSAMAVLDSFRDDHTKGRTALYRLIMIAFDTMRDDGAKEFKKERDAEGWIDVHSSLCEAIATIPATFGKKVRPERVFRLARKIRVRMDREEAAEQNK